MTPRSKQNLLSAISVGALDAATLVRVVAHTRTDNQSNVAEDFQQTSELDRTQHFARALDLAELNEMAASEDVDVTVASALGKIRKDKEEEGAEFKRSLEQLESYSKSKRECSGCKNGCARKALAAN